MRSRKGWADLYAFEVTRAEQTQLFHQLYQQLRAAILSRRLRPGTKLPSTRELAAQLGVSRSAAVAAYEQLFAEGYTSSRHGSGTYISSDLPEPIDGNAQRRKKPVAGATSNAAKLQSIGDFVDVTVQSDERPFNLGRTLVDDRTVELWRKLNACSRAPRPGD
jgi:GntR family transcriptional regulator/MocR family aminotransferase